MASRWFEGIEEFYVVSSDLGKAGREALPMARVAIQKTCQDIVADAKVLAPVDTGNLRNSITYETRENVYSVVGEVGPTAEYGIYQEFGTSRHGPQPFMTPAFDRRAPLLEQALAQIADRFGGK